MSHIAVAILMIASQVAPSTRQQERPVEHPTFYRTMQVDGLWLFYREAGPKDAPALLFARLSGSYHLIAPDYPGFGHSDWPDPKTFAYTFDRYAEIRRLSHQRRGVSALAGLDARQAAAPSRYLGQIRPVVRSIRAIRVSARCSRRRRARARRRALRARYRGGRNRRARARFSELCPHPPLAER